MSASSYLILSIRPLASNLSHVEYSLNSCSCFIDISATDFNILISTSSVTLLSYLNLQNLVAAVLVVPYISSLSLYEYNLWNSGLS